MATKPARARKAKDYPGGPWGYRLAQRLRILVTRAGGVRKFAIRLSDPDSEFSPALVSAYLNGTRQPGTKSLRLISERAGVSLDWLLFGEGGEEPRRRGESWTRGEFEDELAARIIHGLADAAADGELVPGEHYSGWTCFAQGILDRAITEQVRTLREFREWRRRIKAVRAALRSAAFSPHEYVEAIFSAADDPRSEQVRRLHEAEERLSAALQAFDPPVVPFVWARETRSSSEQVTSANPAAPSLRRDLARADAVRPSGVPTWVGMYYVASGRLLGRSATAAENARDDHAPNPERARRVAAEGPRQ